MLTAVNLSSFRYEEYIDNLRENFAVYLEYKEKTSQIDFQDLLVWHQINDEDPFVVFQVCSQASSFLAQKLVIH